MEREDQLKTYLGHKNGVLLQDCLDTWRTALMGLQAGRVFNMKLLAAFVSEWRDAAKGMATLLTFQTLSFKLFLYYLRCYIKL